MADINVFQPCLGAEELDAVQRVFRSNWLGRGPITDDFERAFAAWLSVDPAAVQSVTCCTEALFQIVALLGLGEGDEVVLPSIGFVGAANAIAASGALPVFCDVDPRSLNPGAVHIERVLTRRTKAIVVLHYGGVPCDIDDIVDLAARHGIPVIEDSACSVASRHKGRACGTIGDFGAWSFDAMKILVTGDGGMLFCRDPAMAARARKAVYMGLSATSGISSAIDRRWWEFEVSCFGRRAIMNDMTSAIGLQQLAKLPRFVARRRQLHERYVEQLGGVEWLQLPPLIGRDVESSYYFFWIQVPAEARDGLACALRRQGIYTTFRYYPLHLVARYGSNVSLPGAETAASTTLCLPLHQSLTEADIDRIASCVRAHGADGA